MGALGAEVGAGGGEAATAVVVAAAGAIEWLAVLLTRVCAPAAALEDGLPLTDAVPVEGERGVTV